MKYKIKIIAGILLMAGCTILFAEELCTEDFILNARFDDVDNLGVPCDWEKRAKDGVDVSIENGIVKMQVNDGGNVDKGVLALGQKFLDPNAILGALADDTMHLRAWVKTTAIEEPTDEELLALFWTKHTPEDTATYHFHNNTHSHAGFELVVQEAIRMPAPPFYKAVGWTPWFDHDGSEINEWTPVKGSVVLGNDVNTLHFWILLRSKIACTVWVDNIQISSSPEFCGEAFEKPGTVPVQRRNAEMRMSNEYSIVNNKIQFNEEIRYTLKVYTTKGQICINQSGKGKSINVHGVRLPAGAYILDLTTERGKRVQSFVMPLHKY